MFNLSIAVQIQHFYTKLFCFRSGYCPHPLSRVLLEISTFFVDPPPPNLTTQMTAIKMITELK